MKQKLFMLAISLLGFVAVKANNGGPGDGKKDELNGTVVHSDTKKPLKDVSVTAVLVSKKEKIVFTEENGTYAFDELKPGTYKFIFEKAGFKKHQLTIYKKPHLRTGLLFFMAGFGKHSS